MGRKGAMLKGKQGNYSIIAMGMRRRNDVEEAWWLNDSSINQTILNWLGLNLQLLFHTDPSRDIQI
jgi:hypothetical protein